MADKHIVTRYDFDTICAGVYRLIEEPGLYEKYRQFLDPEMFFQRDSSNHIKALRKIITELHRIYKEGYIKKLSVQFFDGEMGKFADSEINEDTKRLFARMRSDENIRQKTLDPGCFVQFLNYLKIILVAKNFGEFHTKYQNGNIGEAEKILQDTLGDLSKVRQEQSFQFDPDKLLEDLYEDDKIHMNILNIGCKELDSEIGGFEPQTLNLFISTPNGGKTAMCHHIIRRCLEQGLPVHVTCVEDRPKSFKRKITAALTGIPIKRIRNQKDWTSEEKAKVDAAAALMKQFLFVEFVYGEGVDAVHKRKLDFDRQRASKNLPIPVVDILDYTGHIYSKSPGEKSYEQFRAAFAARKDFALANNKICFDFAQVNRDGSKKLNDKKLITMSDLAGAFDLAQVADNMISLNRSPQNISESRSVLHICKARDGAVGGTFDVGVDFYCYRYNMQDSIWRNAPINVMNEKEQEQKNAIP